MEELSLSVARMVAFLWMGHRVWWQRQLRGCAQVAHEVHARSLCLHLLLGHGESAARPVSSVAL